MKAYFVLLFSLITLYGFSQDVQWANEVIEYSSQFSGRDFSASQATGPPNVMKFGSKDPAAWMASAPDNQEYLVLGFDEPIKARQIIIVESSNPGAIQMVYVYDDSNTMHLVGEFTPGPVEENNRILNIFLPTYNFNVQAVKIVLDGSKVQGANSIDAVGLSNSVLPVQFGERFAFRLNPRLIKRKVDLNASGDESDIRPVYSVDEQTLFFTRGYSEENAGGINDPGDVWYSTYNPANGKYSDPVRMGEDINNIGFNTTNAYYKYGDNPRLMVGNVSGKANKVKSNLVVVEKKNGEWSGYEEQKIKNGSDIPMDADYTVTNNGNILIIASELRDSKGGTDLYVSTYEGDGKWSAPENLTTINTEEDEYAPFFSMEENALYFTSLGYGGIGEGDIFRVRRLDDSWNNWSEPENIGADINSPGNDHYFYFDDQDSYAYFAQGSSDGSMEIVRINRPRFMDDNPLVVVKGKVMDEEEATPINALLSLLIIPQEEVYGVAFSEENSGDYQIFLRSGYQYKLVGEKPGYKTVEMPITLENKDKPYTYDLNIFLSRDLTESQPDLAAEVMAISTGIENYDAEEADAALVAAEEMDMIEEEEKADEIVRMEELEAEAEEELSMEADEILKLDQAVPQEQERSEDLEQPAREYQSRPAARSYAKVSAGALRNLVVFNFDSDELLSPSFPVLDAMVAFMKKHPDLQLEVGGFTDYIGDYYYNMELSKNRAHAVRQYMVNQGIQNWRIRVIGFGEKMPVVGDLDSELITLNRRAEFNFTRY